MKFAVRLFGTIVFTIISAAILGTGVWLIGSLLLATLPEYVAIPAILGLIASPPMLFVDLLSLLREDDARRAEKTEQDATGVD